MPLEFRLDYKKHENFLFNFAPIRCMIGVRIIIYWPGGYYAKNSIEYQYR